jgi:ADP-heptose:LPS heptosyltransferase
MRHRIKYFLTLPISPWSFIAIIFMLRKVDVLRTPISTRPKLIRRIFISHPYSSVGDLVLMLPLLERIRSEWPAATLDIVVGSNACKLLAGVDGLHRIFVCGSQNARIALFGIYKRFFRNLLLYRREIMPFDYDLAIVARWGSIMTSEAIYLAYLTGASLRIGYSASVDHGDESIDRLLTRAATGGEHEHETTRNLKLLDRALLTRNGQDYDTTVSRPIESLLNLAFKAKAESPAMGFLKGSFTAPKTFAVVSPGATRPFNRWPVERLAMVMQELFRKTGLYFCVVGSASDAHLCTDLVGLAPECARSVAGATSLIELTYLLSESQMFLGMDSGTAHISGGLGTPTIVISPFPSECQDDLPNSPVRFRPCGPRVHILQPARSIPPCSPNCTVSEPHCILQVSVEEVLSTAIELLENAKR